MTISAKYDPEARAMYLHLRDAPVASSIEVDEDFVVDLDSDSAPVGVEVLFVPVTRGQIDEVARRFGLDEQADAIWAQVQAAQPAPRTRSGTAVYMTVHFFATGVPLVTGASSAAMDIDAHDYALAG